MHEAPGRCDEGVGVVRERAELLREPLATDDGREAQVREARERPRKLERLRRGGRGAGRAGRGLACRPQTIPRGTCVASSRVGERTTARAPTRVLCAWRRSTSGMRKAAVLPEPVRAMATTSFPVRATGSVLRCTGVGCWYPANETQGKAGRGASGSQPTSAIAAPMRRMPDRTGCDRPRAWKPPPLLFFFAFPLAPSPPAAPDAAAKAGNTGSAPVSSGASLGPPGRPRLRLQEGADDGGTTRDSAAGKCENAPCCRRRSSRRESKTFKVHLSCVLPLLGEESLVALSRARKSSRGMDCGTRKNFEFACNGGTILNEA